MTRLTASNDRLCDEYLHRDEATYPARVIDQDMGVDDPRSQSVPFLGSGFIISSSVSWRKVTAPLADRSLQPVDDLLVKLARRGGRDRWKKELDGYGRKGGRMELQFVSVDKTGHHPFLIQLAF